MKMQVHKIKNSASQRNLTHFLLNNQNKKCAGVKYVENFQPFQEEWFNSFLIFLSQFNHAGSWMVHSEWKLKYILGPRYSHSDYSFIRNLFEKLVELINSLEARWQTNIKNFPSDICTYFGFSLIIPLCKVMYAWWMRR